MLSGRVANLKVGRRPKVKVAHLIFSSLYNAFMFTVSSKQAWIRFFNKGFNFYLFNGFYIFFAFSRFVFYCYDFIVSKNKNIGKIFAFLRELAAITLIVIGVILTSIGLLTLSSYFFISSGVVNFFYNSSISAYSAIRFLFANNAEEKNIYKINLKKHFLNALFASLMITALSLLMIFKIFPGPMAIVCAGLSIIGFAYAANGAYLLHKNKKTNFDLSAEMLLQNESSTQVISKQLLAENIKAHEPSFYHDYFYKKNDVNLPDFQADSKQYLLTEVSHQIETLKREIIKDKHPFFSQFKKRCNKIKVLNQLTNLITNDNAGLREFYNLLEAPEFDLILNNPFQSLFKQTSRTAQTFILAERYFSEIDEKSHNLLPTIS